MSEAGGGRAGGEARAVSVVEVARDRRTLTAGDIDVAATLRPLGVSRRDPTHRWGPNWFTRAVITPDGAGTMRLQWDRFGAVVAEAWGPGAAWLLERAPHWIGLHDDPTGFAPDRHPLVAACHRRRPGLRMTAGGVVWQELIFTVLGQRVTTTEASRSWARMVYRWGEPAPGPCALRLPPTPAALARLSYVDLHRINVERHRADAILGAARRAARLEEAATMGVDAAFARLTALRGLGPWTATSVISVCHGDPDTVVLRDYGLPTMVNYAFTGDGRRLVADEGGDEVMCAHLAPWAGHRQRVVRLLATSGRFPPRRAPRAYNPDIRRL